MRKIVIWHCYFYGPDDTWVILAESEDALRSKVRDQIAAEWDLEGQGPMPEGWDALVEAFDDWQCGHAYFGDWGWSVVDSTLCEPAEADQ